MTESSNSNATEPLLDKADNISNEMALQLAEHHDAIDNTSARKWQQEFQPKLAQLLQQVNIPGLDDA